MNGKFFRNDTPERLAKLDGQILLLEQKIETLNAEWTARLLEQQNAYDREMEEMEDALLARITQAEKSLRSNSLKVEGNKDEGEQIGSGYVRWSQRKVNRITASKAEGFAEKVLRRSQKKAAAS
jgi:hypothetical protein